MDLRGRAPLRVIPHLPLMRLPDSSGEGKRV
jgi:hypothetical protein